MSRQYLNAATLVEVVLDGGSMKRHCSSTKVGKVEFALANETLKFKSILDSILTISKISSESLDVRYPLLLVMLYELLLGNRKIEGGGAVKRRIISHKTVLQQTLDMLMEGKKSKLDLLNKSMIEALNMPKFIRINESKISIDDGMQYIKNICPEAKVDPFVPSLVVIPPTFASLGRDAWVGEGSLIIQDKASCFPSQIMSDEWTGGSVIDACAAPGNKTSHLAVNMKKCVDREGGCPVLFAFDKSLVRSRLLSDRMQQSGVDDVVTVINQDFLEVDVFHKSYESVRAVMLDPSCSGSGVVRTVERLVDIGERDVETPNDPLSATKKSHRLDQLAAFQLAAIQKAATFPYVDTIVYSTCSVHLTENEVVVSKALASLSGEGWRVVSPRKFEKWHRRGMCVDGLSEEQAKCMIRCLPEDGTNGFFVALLKREKGRRSLMAIKSQQETTHQFPAKVGVERKRSSANEGDYSAQRPRCEREETSCSRTESSVKSKQATLQKNKSSNLKAALTTNTTPRSLFGKYFKVQRTRKTPAQRR